MQNSKEQQLNNFVHKSNVPLNFVLINKFASCCYSDIELSYFCCFVNLYFFNSFIRKFMTFLKRIFCCTNYSKCIICYYLFYLTQN